MIIQGNVNPEAKPVKSYVFGLFQVFKSQQDAADWSKTTGKGCIYITQ